MTSRQAYEQASNEFKANRCSMSQTQCEEARKSLSRMFKELQLQESLQAFKVGEKIES